MPVSVRARLPTRSAALDELVEHPAGAAVLLRHGERGPDLAEDLALADDHRVQSAGHREQVLHGPVLVVHVQVRAQLLQPDPGVPAQQFGDVGQAAVELLDDGVDLHPVAGGEHRDLGEVLGGGGVGEQLVQAVAGQRRPLQQADRSRCGATDR